MKITTIDLKFFNRTNDIATYLIEYARGAVIIDPGPESTLPKLMSELNNRGLNEKNITHIFLTHIHLDHAGSAGWFAQKGAQIIVHPVGVPHMLQPEKLLSSASRLYGDWMDKLWGDMKPVPPDHLLNIEDEGKLVLGDLCIQAIYTPGHANHHICYLCDETIFTGDVGGVRFPFYKYVRLPFVPPETDLGKWHSSLERIGVAGCKQIAPTHYGIYRDARDHVEMSIIFLNQVTQWLEDVMPDIEDIEMLCDRYSVFLKNHARAAGIDDKALSKYDSGNPIGFAASGLFRYWNKVRSRT